MNLFRLIKTHSGHLSEHVRAGGASGAGEYFAKLLSRKIQQKSGTNIYDRSNEWDLLIVLDAARVDAIQKLAADVDFLSDPDEITSVASSSETWMKRIFTSSHKSEMEQTAYICANPFSDDLLSESDFGWLAEVWREGWDDHLGTVPAPVVTDTAIEIGRRESPSKMIVHYMQPHFPSVPHSETDTSAMDLEAFGEQWESIWDDLRGGNIDRDKAWQMYLDNLRYVLEEVNVLINNIDGEKVIITADHGNAFGEWWQWGHPKYVKTDEIRQVPWYSTTATDEQTVVPPRENRGETEENISVDDRLEALGYK